MDESVIKVAFQPRWKEELVCTTASGTFTLEMPMGAPAVYFPTSSKWSEVAPSWAQPYWASVQKQLAAWCNSQNVALHIEESAGFYGQ